MKKIKIFMFIIAAVTALAVTVLAVAYDSGGDPLVSLSYITDIFKPQIEREITSSAAELRGEIDALNKKIEALTASAGVTPESRNIEEYDVLYLQKGEKILAATQCEFILRVGEAEIVSPYENQGVADLTEGKDLAGGTGILKNHLLLVPRGGDGRGVVVTSESAYVMVRGEYEIAK